MSKHDDKADNTLPQTKIVNTEQQDFIQRFSDLQDGLNNVFASYRFIGEAVIAMTDPERMDEFEDWHLGLFLHQQWGRRQADKLMAELVKVKRSIKT